MDLRRPQRPVTFWTATAAMTVSVHAADFRDRRPGKRRPHRTPPANCSPTSSGTTTPRDRSSPGSSSSWKPANQRLSRNSLLPAAAEKEGGAGPERLPGAEIGGRSAALTQFPGDHQSDGSRRERGEAGRGRERGRRARGAGSADGRARVIAESSRSAGRELTAITRANPWGPGSPWMFPRGGEVAALFRGRLSMMWELSTVNPASGTVLDDRGEFPAGGPGTLHEKGTPPLASSRPPGHGHRKPRPPPQAESIPATPR